MLKTPAADAVNTGWRLALMGAAWPAGAALQLREPTLQSIQAYGVCAASGLLLIAVSVLTRRHRWLCALACALGLALLAFGATGGRASWRLAETLPASIEGQDLQITGVVASLPQRSSSGLRFRFEVDPSMQGGQPVTVPSIVSIGWYHGFHEDATLSAPQLELRAGQRWQFTVRLRRPHGLSNPHGFDQELQSFEEGVRAIGSVRDVPAPQLLDRAAAHPVERLRQRMRDAIEAAVPDRRAAGVLTALAVGDQSSIDREDWDLFRRAGIAHLVSISGLHITMFAWLAGAVIGALWRRSVRATQWIAAPTAALWGGFAVAWVYSVFSGWGVPAQRTVWMLGTVVLLRSAGLRWPWPLVLLSAATVVTALDPWALLQPGFWLSFVAVGLLMVSGNSKVMSAANGQTPDVDLDLHDTAAVHPPSPHWRGGIAKLRGVMSGGLQTQVVATLGLTPLTLVIFQQLSLVGFVANLVAIPVITLIITPLALLGSVAPVLWAAGAWVVSALASWIGWLAGAPAAVWSVGVAPWWAQAAGLLAAAVLLMPLPWRVRALAVPLVLPLLLPPRELPALGQFEVVAADVGQGTAVIVRTRHHVMVYDAGPQYSPDSDAGQRVLLPLLRSRGDHRIDLLMLSHRDTDHVGGASALLRDLPIGDLVSSIEDLHPLRLEARWRSMPTSRCRAGQQWNWDGVRFEVLHPSGDDYAAALRPNMMSCVVRVQGSGASVLLTGDIERDQEIRLLREHREALRSDVLLVPHHGSKTSSSAAFLDAVAPQVAVFQAGHRNRYGHPADEVLARYRERGIDILVSPSCGAWTWRSEPTGVDQRGGCERVQVPRYWHWRTESVGVR
ncbi:MAG: DNA internalization-related competence protein ComEC/Rec2 [Pseudomonadota bacterium]|nr:DNA internalization-related competence protein ComEC/Rec2 [Pseudomonadota bacterium]